MNSVTRAAAVLLLAAWSIIPARAVPQNEAGQALALATQSVTVSISPRYAPLVIDKTLQFSAKITGSSNTVVTWQVNGVDGGSPSIGTISASGLFTAPSVVPDPAIVNITAVSKASPAATATATLTLVAHAATGSIHYVATTGKDSNPGSLSLPWHTIQHAANSAHAGDTIYARGGVYNETVTIPVSGSATSGYLTFSSYPGELAVIDGARIPNPDGGLVTVQKPNYVVINGFEIRNFKTSSTADTPVGIYASGAGENLQIINNHIHDIVSTAKGCPCDVCSNNANALGLDIEGTQAPQSIDGLAISGNQVDHLATGCSESLTVDGNILHFAITDNIVHDNNNIGIDAIGFEGVSPNAAYDQARYGEIRGNAVYNISSQGNPSYSDAPYSAGGIYVDGGAHITVEQNVINNADIGLEITSEHLGRYASYVTARNNLIYRSNSAGISIGGYDSSRGGTQHCNIVNNTLYQNDTKNTGSGEFQIQYYSSANLFENNILFATVNGLFLNGYVQNPSTPVVVDYNLYYSTAGITDSQWIYQGTTYTGYSSYLKGTGNDRKSPPFSDPNFLSLAPQLNLDLHSASPAINAGINLGGAIVGTVDFSGNPRVNGAGINLGAYEQ